MVMKLTVELGCQKSSGDHRGQHFEETSRASRKAQQRRRHYSQF